MLCIVVSFSSIIRFFAVCHVGANGQGAVVARVDSEVGTDEEVDESKFLVLMVTTSVS